MQTQNNIDDLAQDVFMTCVMQAALCDKGEYKNLPDYFPAFADNMNAAMFGNKEISKEDGDYYKRQILILYYACRLIDKWLEKNLVKDNPKNIEICKFFYSKFLTVCKFSDTNAQEGVIGRLREVEKRLSGLINTKEN